MKKPPRPAKPSHKVRVLFVCTANQQRSPTAEHMYASDKRFEVKSAGASELALRPVDLDLVRWAEWIVVMEDQHRQEIERRFSGELGSRRIFVLDIPDIYHYGDTTLMREIRDRFEPVYRKEKEEASDA